MMKYLLAICLFLLASTYAIAQPTYVELDKSAAQSTDPISHTVPADWSAGDLVVAFVHTQTRTVTTPPTGWVLHDSITGTFGNFYIYTKTLEAGDLGTTYDWDLSTSPFNGFIVFHRITGHDSSSPVNDSATADDGSAVTDHVFASVTTTVDNCLVLHMASTDTNNMTPSSGSTGTEQYDTVPYYLATQTKATAGALGTATYTTSIGRRNFLSTVAIAPVSSTYTIPANLNGNLNLHLNGNLQ